MQLVVSEKFFLKSVDVQSADSKIWKKWKLNFGCQQKKRDLIINRKKLIDIHGRWCAVSVGCLTPMLMYGREAPYTNADKTVATNYFVLITLYFDKINIEFLDKYRHRKSGTAFL